MIIGNVDFRSVMQNFRRLNIMTLVVVYESHPNIYYL